MVVISTCSAKASQKACELSPFPSQEGERLGRQSTRGEGTGRHSNDANRQVNAETVATWSDVMEDWDMAGIAYDWLVVKDNSNWSCWGLWPFIIVNRNNA